MTYLTTAQTAQLKGCSLQYVQKCVKGGKISAEVKANAANNRTEYIIPLTALPQDLQLKWENQQRRSLGLEPIKKAVKAPLKPAENRLTLDDLTDTQRTVPLDGNNQGLADYPGQLRAVQQGRN